MSSTIVNARHWRGFSGLRHLVIFGDSYSAVGYNIHGPHPTQEAPLGIPFPGETWSEFNLEENRSEPNWVGFLLSEFSGAQEILAYDYAVGGDRVEGVVQQVQQCFLPSAGPKPEWAAWSADDSLFVTWVGINDLAFIGDESAIRSKLRKLFDQQVALHNAGARNFLFIDVPPVHRSPAIHPIKGGQNQSRIAARVALWNTLLHEYAINFAAEYGNVTVMIFSSYDTFSRILDTPSEFGFEPGDVRRCGGSIWVDHVHPSSKVHRLVASDIAKFLKLPVSHTHQ